MLSILMVAAVGAGCSGRYGGSDPLPTDETNGAQSAPPIQAIDVGSASSADCPAGGKVYSVYVDENRNGIKDLDDTILSTQIVCNGINGQDGQNGAAGENGQNGANGANGHGVVFKVLAAPVQVCPAGGSTILLATDVRDDGVYALDLPNQQAATICNGENALTPSYAPVDALHPCGNTVAFKEVLLRLQNGQVLGSFSTDMAGSLTRLAFLTDGAYVDTDGSNCAFSLSTSADGGTRSISWDGQIQKQWPVFY